MKVYGYAGPGMVSFSPCILRLRVCFSKVYSGEGSMFKSLVASLYKYSDCFQGVFACDKLPNPVNGIYIVNTQMSSKPGEHCIAMFFIDTKAEYFD